MTQEAVVDISVPELDPRGTDAVERQLLALPGVTDVSVEGERVRVVVDREVASDEELLAAVAQQGYEPHFVE